jgi:hypothetical protein
LPATGFSLSMPLAIAPRGWRIERSVWLAATGRYPLEKRLSLSS